MTEYKNFMALAVTDIPKDTEYRRCNFARQSCIDDRKGVRLFPGDDTPRTFVMCNLCNCEPPPGSILVNCNTSISEKQAHISSDYVDIDGEHIEVKEYADIIYGRYKDGGYVYKIPIIIPCGPPED